MNKFPSVAVLLALCACTPHADKTGASSPSPSASAEPAIAPAPPAPAPDLRTFRLKVWTKEAYPDLGKLTLKWGAVDLDDDGKDEVLAYVGGPMMCGTGGCPLSILRDEGTNFEVISRTSVNHLPLGVLETRTGGMRDIWVTVYGGGVPEQLRRLRWNGARYPFNPTVPPTEQIETPGKIVIADGPLEPID